MKRKYLALFILGAIALLIVANAFAAEAKKAAAPKSWTGEVVDLGCYMGHGAKGEGHKECGAKCVANGMPMGLLTNGNKVYVLTMNHDNADPFNHLKDMVSHQVKVTGEMSTRGGIQSIEVVAAEAASPAK